MTIFSTWSRLREKTRRSISASVAVLLSIARSRPWQAIQGRSYVTPDDIQQLAPPVLRHRLIHGPDTRLHGTSVASVLEGIIQSVTVPVEENWQEALASTEPSDQLGTFGEDLEQELEAAVAPELR